MKTKAIASAKVKTDKVDAKILAHLLRTDLVAESYVPPKQIREIRALIRHRLSLMKMRTMVKNKVHALTDKYGYRCEYSDLFGVSQGKSTYFLEGDFFKYNNIKSSHRYYLNNSLCCRYPYCLR